MPRMTELTFVWADARDPEFKLGVDFVPKVGERVVTPRYRDATVSRVVHDYTETPHMIRIYLERP
jgi:hypothetical protein